MKDHNERVESLVSSTSDTKIDMQAFWGNFVELFEDTMTGRIQDLKDKPINRLIS